MRLICPHCQLSVTFPDTSAGTPTPCPQCGQSITPPALTGAAIDAAPVPAPAPPPVRAGSVSDGPSVRAGSVSNGPPPAPSVTIPARTNTGHPWFHLALRRPVAHWLAPGALLLVLVLTFFTWVAVAPNGSRVYTQNAWQAAGGGFTTDLIGERVLKAESDLKEHSHWNVWLLFFLILLIPAAIIAVADRVLRDRPTVIPDVLRVVWPHRQTIIASLCALLLVLLIVPLTLRFGLESAALAVAEAEVPPPLPAPGKPEPTTTEWAERDLKRDLAVARFGLERTIWLKLALTAQIIALFGAGLAIWLDKHPTAPDPRLEIYC